MQNDVLLLPLQPTVYLDTSGIQRNHNVYEQCKKERTTALPA